MADKFLLDVLLLPYYYHDVSLYLKNQYDWVDYIVIEFPLILNVHMDENSMIEIPFGWYWTIFPGCM